MCVNICIFFNVFFFFQAEDGIRDLIVTGVQTCALPILGLPAESSCARPAPPRQDGGADPARTCSTAAPTAAPVSPDPTPRTSSAGSVGSSSGSPAASPTHRPG